jgi:hypothetical protein
MLDLDARAVLLDQIEMLVRGGEEGIKWRQQRAGLEATAVEDLFGEKQLSLVHYLRRRHAIGLGRIAFVSKFRELLETARISDPLVRREARAELNSALDEMRSWIAPPGRPGPSGLEVWRACQGAAKLLGVARGQRAAARREIRDGLGVSKPLLEMAIKRAHEIEEWRPWDSSEPVTAEEIWSSFRAEALGEAVEDVTQRRPRKSRFLKQR